MSFGAPQVIAAKPARLEVSIGVRLGRAGDLFPEKNVGFRAKRHENQCLTRTRISVLVLCQHENHCLSFVPARESVS